VIYKIFLKTQSRDSEECSTKAKETYAPEEREAPITQGRVSKSEENHQYDQSGGSWFY